MLLIGGKGFLRKTQAVSAEKKKGIMEKKPALVQTARFFRLERKTETSL